MKFAGIELKPETILLTRQHFADIYQRCIDGAVEFYSIPKDELPAGKFFVNDAESYKESNRQRIEVMLAGDGDHTFTFMQRAHWIQTGESVALLS